MLEVQDLDRLEKPDVSVSYVGVDIVDSATSLDVPLKRHALGMGLVLRQDAPDADVGVPAAVGGDSVDLDAEAAVVRDDDHRALHPRPIAAPRCSLVLLPARMAVVIIRSPHAC